MLHNNKPSKLTTTRTPIIKVRGVFDNGSRLNLRFYSIKECIYWISDNYNLKEIAISESTGIFNDCKAMFGSLTNITKIDLTNFNITNVVNTSCMFWGCDSLKEIIMPAYDFTKVTDMSFMFQRCKSLVTLDLSRVKLQLYTNTRNMFDKCTSLKRIICSSYSDIIGFQREMDDALIDSIELVKLKSENK